ncbi:hypothetical protein [Mesorhizobium sp. M0228]|uniref:hypothetical protein n=1 Tax=Mesorhizobium sp. M0228 TaxID=2956923 RepID=UPI003338B556
MAKNSRSFQRRSSSCQLNTAWPFSVILNAGSSFMFIAPLKAIPAQPSRIEQKGNKSDGNDTSAGTGSTNARNHISVGRMLMAQAP